MHLRHCASQAIVAKKRLGHGSAVSNIIADVSKTWKWRKSSGGGAEFEFFLGGIFRVVVVAVFRNFAEDFWRFWKVFRIGRVFLHRDTFLQLFFFGPKVIIIELKIHRKCELRILFSQTSLTEIFLQVKGFKFHPLLRLLFLSTIVLFYCDEI